MAIVKMNKFTLLGFESKKAELLEKLQNFAEVEFINLQDESFLENNNDLADLIKDQSDSEFAECEDKLSMAKFALQFLAEYVPQKSGIKAMREGKRELTLQELEEKVTNSNWESIVDKVKEKEAEMASLDSEKTKLQGIIDSMTPWEQLDAPFEELNSMKTPHFLGTVPKQYEEELTSQLADYYLEVLHNGTQDISFLVMCDNDKEEIVAEILRGFGFSQFKTDLSDVPLKIIHDSRDTIEKIRSKKFFLCEELATFEEDYKTLELVNEYYGNEVVKKNAINNFLKTESVMVVQGWIPAEENDNLTVIVKEVLGEDGFITFEEVKDEEVEHVPVKLKNNEINTAFESITQMFSTPRYDDIDPTPFVTPFFLLFFGMMVADVGYGLLVVLGAGLALKLFNFDEDTKKFIKFFYYLGYPIIGFGVIYGSFFGDLIKMPIQLVNPNTDITTVLIASVIFGTIQIFFGLGIKAYVLIKAGKPKDAFYDVGAWVITLVSIALVLGSGMLGLPSIVKTIAIGTMIFGMVVIVLTGGREEKSVGARLGQGAYALYGITGYIGDLVSYTRLMALGLAGGSLAGAFNMISKMIPGVAAIVFVPLIIIVGHVFNLALSLLGAYVHTCRLQYVEYFGKFYEGGGREFTPFKTQNKFIKTKRD